MAKAHANLNTSDWEVIDEEFDLVPMPGSFVSPDGMKPYTIMGETVQGLTYLHAFYRQVGAKIRAHGGELGKCDHCGARVRYCFIFEDSKGQWFHTGRDCAELIGAKQRGDTPEEFYHARKLFRIAQEARKVKTKNGPKVVYSMEAPQWVWKLSPEVRRSLCSVGKNMHRGGQWEVTFWANSVEEILSMWERFQAAKP